MELEKYDEAIADFSKAIELNPDFMGTYYNRGSVYIKLGKYAEACADFTKFIEINPDYADAYCERGNCHYELKNYKDALTDYLQALETGKAPSFLFRLILINFAT